MKALILAGGYATRLLPLTKDKAKPLLTVKDIPIIEYIVHKIETVDEIDTIYVVTNNKFCNDFLAWNKAQACPKKIEIINDQTMSDETKLGAIGDIRFVMSRKKISEDLLIVAGDNLFSFDLKEFVRKASAVKPAASLGVYDVSDSEHARLYGIVTLDEHNQIIEFQEKPSEPKSTLAAVGIYLLPKDVLKLIERYLQEGNTGDQPGYFISWLIKAHRVFGYSLAGKWFDIGSIESYNQANREWKVE